MSLFRGNKELPEMLNTSVLSLAGMVKLGEALNLKNVRLCVD
jgi:hypothetical protein